MFSQKLPQVSQKLLTLLNNYDKHINLTVGKQKIRTAWKL